MTSDLAPTLTGALASLEADPRPVRAYLASLGSENSRASMSANLLRAAREFAAIAGKEAPDDPEAIPWHRMQPAHVDALAARLADTYSPSTANVTLAAVRGVHKAAERLGLLDPVQLRRLTENSNGRAHYVKGRVPDTGRHLSPGELAALFRAASGDFLLERGARDAALLAILDGGGLRRAEACALDVGDVDLEAEVVTVRRG